MVKPKTVQAKVKAKARAASKAAEQPSSNDNVLARKEMDDMRKSPKGSGSGSGSAKDVAAKTPANAAVGPLEDDIMTVAKSAAKTQVRVTEIAKAVMAVKDSGSLTAKIVKAKVAKEGKPAQAKDSEKSPLAPQDLEARRMRLKNLIVQGKERGYLTYAEINDHLPDDMLDAEQIENIISMNNDMGIQVYDEAPDAETLLMSEVTPAVTDEAAVEEAEAALSTVDSEFGRTTDPVRMYM